MIAVLISIRPEWCEKIINGRKTIEVRKTRPKLNPPFKCYIYCTKGRPDLNIPIPQERLMRDYLETGSMKSLNCPLGNEKVIGEFTCNRVTNLFSNSRFWLGEDDVLHTCLSAAEMRKYANGANGLYGWHISNLRIYDTPRELDDFRRACKNDWWCESCAMYCEHNRTCGNGSLQIRRPPQSWCYVEEELWND